MQTVRSTTLVLAQENIDTDQIIPARYLTTTTRSGLGRFVFADWRYQPDGEMTDCPLNELQAKQRQILIAGNNFGCGSSREHAPWALHDFGFRAVVSSQIADIFGRNALKNGLLPVVVDAVMHGHLLRNPGVEVVIDIDKRTLSCGGREVGFPLDCFARYLLLEDVDEFDYLCKQLPAIRAFEAR